MQRRELLKQLAAGSASLGAAQFLRFFMNYGLPNTAMRAQRMALEKAGEYVKKENY